MNGTKNRDFKLQPAYGDSMQGVLELGVPLGTLRIDRGHRMITRGPLKLWQESMLLLNMDPHIPLFLRPVVQVAS